MVVVTAWWLIGLAISARNGLGLRFAVGNAGVVVVAWACDLGVVVAWACRSCGSRPGFADLGWRSGLAGICLVGYFWLLRNFICGGFWLLRNFICDLWWFFVAEK